MDKVTIIVPTYNEADNIPSLVAGIRKAVGDVNILVVDDNSPDGTSRVASESGCEVITRTENRGLAASVICGLGYITSGVIVIMDADLSHSPDDLPRMLKAIADGNDLAIGSRYVPGGSTPDWSRMRCWMSHFGSRVMCLFTGIHDLNSGFTAFRRSCIDPSTMRDDSWKLLFELYSKGRWKKYTEVPITFCERRAGNSKFNLNQLVKGMAHFVRMIATRKGGNGYYVEPDTDIP